MRKQINSFEIEFANGDIYEMSSGTGVPPANSVNSQTIENKTVQKEDLADDLLADILEVDEVNTIGTDHARNMVADIISRHEGQTQEAGAGEDEVTGDGPSLDDLDDPGTGDGQDLDDI